jgi:hypothetical protein
MIIHVDTTSIRVKEMENEQGEIGRGHLNYRLNYMETSTQ